MLSGSDTNKRYHGFTLIETLITVAILSILVSSYAAFKLRTDIAELNQRLSHALIEEITLIGNQAQTVYAKIGKWPDYANRCTNALSAPTMRPIGIDRRSPFPAVDYAVSCTAQLFTIDIEMPASLDTWAHYIKAQTPSINNSLTLSSGNQSLTSKWPPPADITLFKRLLDDYYKTDGSKPMTGDMNLDGNNIVDIGKADGDDFELKRGTPSRRHSLGKTVANIQLVRAGDTIAKPNCTSPKIYITSANIGNPAGRPVTSIQWTAGSSGNMWIIENTLSDDRKFSVNDKTYLRGIAIVKCA